MQRWIPLLLVVCAASTNVRLVSAQGKDQAAPASAPATPATTPPATPPVKTSCKVQRDPPSAAEIALSQEDYDKALDLYRKMDTTAPDVSREGVVRVLIEQNKSTEAAKLAHAWLDAEPANGSAQVTMGEVFYRQGQLQDAFLAATNAIRANPCVARAYLLGAAVQHLAGNHATEKKHIEMAYRLAPTDIEIRREWISTLSRKRQLEESALVIKDGLLNDKEQAEVKNALAHERDFASATCLPSAPVEHVSLPIRSIMDGPTRRTGFALDVKFNGKSRRLEIDTGASGLLLSREATGGLNLTRSTDELKTETGGVGSQGSVASAITFVESVKIGEVEFHNCAVELLGKRGRLDIDGLIGADFFAKYLISLDFRSLLMRLDPLPKRPDDAVNIVEAKDDDSVARPVHDSYRAPEMKDWTKVWRNGHEMLLPVSIGQAKDKLFLIDTGAGLMSISPEAAREVTHVSKSWDMQVSGISGKVDQVFETRDFKLLFAGLGLKVDSMTAFDTTSISHNAGVEVSGFMGSPVLYRLALHIDYRDNLVKFEYDPKNDPINYVAARF